MSTYYVTRASSALSTTNDTLTIVGAANRTIKIKRITIGGLGTASASNVVQVARSTGGTTGGGAQTANPMTTGAGATACVVNTTWSAQPTLTSVLDRVPVNANGGLAVIYYPPGQEPELRGTEQLSVRSETGTSNISITVVFDEY